MSVSIVEIPRAAAEACNLLTEQIHTVLGGDLVAVWLHGGTTFPDRGQKTGDLDICIVISRLAATERDPSSWHADSQSRPSRLVAIETALARDLNITFDTMYLLLDEIGGGGVPSRAFDRVRLVNDWPFVRAHLLAGQYVHLFGRRPEETLVAPSRVEIERALDRELEHLERHMCEGDAADPYEATYAVWNGCRILYTLETGSPVISKRSAGAWGLTDLEGVWHPTISAAGRAYDGNASVADLELLRTSAPPFVAMVRDRLQRI